MLRKFLGEKGTDFIQVVEVYCSFFYAGFDTAVFLLPPKSKRKLRMKKAFIHLFTLIKQYT